MAKVAAKDTNIALATVQLEDDIDTWNLQVTNEVPKTNGLSTIGPTRVIGTYDYNLDVSGAADFAAGASDATLYAMLATAGALALDPTGVTADANNPNYDATSVIASQYSLDGSVGNRVGFSCTLVGASALDRAVA